MVAARGTFSFQHAFGGAAVPEPTAPPASGWMLAAGGTFYLGSADASSWQAASGTLPDDGYAQALAWDPLNERYLAARSVGGLYASDDEGGTWTLVEADAINDSGSTSADRATGIFYFPAAGLFLCGPAPFGSTEGHWWSENGQDWYPPETPGYSFSGSIDFDGERFVRFNNRDDPAITRSTDGKNWVNATTVSDGNPSHEGLWAGRWLSSTNEGLLAVSADGVSWTWGTGEALPNIRSMWGRPDGAVILQASSSGIIMRSTDNGDSFTQVADAGDSDAITDIRSSDLDGSLLIAAGHGGKVLVSEDVGATWTDISGTSGLPSGSARVTALAPNVAEHP